VLPSRRRRVFDKAYYDRFYGDAERRVTDEETIGRLGTFVCSYLDHLDVEVSRVLDVGCGIGLWRDVITEHYPEARYTGIEVSEYLCRTRGWKQASVVDYKSRSTFDLVICQGVLQYLNENEARSAIANLAKLTKGAMFLEVLTSEDWENNCDRSVTDNQCFLREAAWYSSRLSRHFTNCGGGVYLSKHFEHFVYALDRIG
jgi:2-polyprenyl-3-methyl-5-hydroxy-6-metoxy-1,4-benzoquinol methylase